MNAITDAMTALTVAAAPGCGLTAGVMLAFSVSVMPGLGRLWTRLNHIRALTGTAGAVALTISALAG